MMTDRTFVWAAEGLYAVSGLLTFDRLRRSSTGPAGHRYNYATMLVAFALHTTFLVLRGQTVKRCPLTNAFEMTVFIAWAAVLFYLVIGPSYRVSFLGAFTSPVAFVICLIGLLGLDDRTHAVPETHNAWIDFHAAIAILAYGAFALAFVTGFMYLFQERQLKTHKLTSSFLLLPAIEQLEVINFRLILFGFGMLTAGMLGGIVSYKIVGRISHPKMAWAIGTYVLYTGLLVGRAVWSLRGRKVVQFSMAFFVIMLSTYWLVSVMGSFYRASQ